MVHGFYYGVQYEICLNKKVDLFDDILPICIDVRTMISLEKGKSSHEQDKLIIIPYRSLDGRFSERQHNRNYVTSLDEIKMNRATNRKTNPRAFKYYDVKMYKMHIKYANNVQQPYTDELFQQLENRLDELTNNYDEEDYSEKYSYEERMQFYYEKSLLIEQLTVQRIIRDKEYFEEIKEIERELTDITLTESEENLVMQVLQHPKIKDIIAYHGINLVDTFY
jgi:hypothetical protein